jgi:hypothetical protein
MAPASPVAMVHPPQPLRGGVVAGGDGKTEDASAPWVACAVDASASGAGAAALPAGMANRGVGPPADSMLSGGSAPRTNAASATAPARGVKPIFDAALA